MPPDAPDPDVPVAIWHEDDNVYRCSECMWELQHGDCTGCQLEFDLDFRDDADDTTNENETFNPDRVSQPRGDTPLRDDEHYMVPSLYFWRRDEYHELRERGATRLMCETFNLEFNADTGIIAWADGDLYDEFAGPLMQKGDFWKIVLGRRFELDEEDLDGSLFIEALLEDALIFPLISGCQWETVEESPGIWVTRPIEPANDSDESVESPDRWGQEADNKLEPAYVAAALPVEAHDYETSDAESDGDGDINMVGDEPSIKKEEEKDELSIEEEDDGDPGWTWEADIPDACWFPRGAMLEGEGEGEIDVAVEEAEDQGSDDDEDQDSDDDSADSDFNSDEVLSGDEIVN
ncbi:hypothetical protein B0H13DRAFT_1636960 [Mycena leptocephala]|nr:hypothetical protein B0H13DRAFT_1636960 [Mycena leptocephala]